ncbi:hypothetical protein HUO13_25835 [Saccharopolyspora erythraea]|uniref:hypothetical protein n=1 Tax=Saccharopolyspora erythraea TaxID=1836 RepID=UPI001BA91AFE|nr:hypothetical protein [Saccharopolyspora erythraea]QUH03779.1 hypothetical protein HUO13_25835 [Saccharopolyspora erythraea]
MSGRRRVTVMSPQTRVAHARRVVRRRWRAPRLDPAEARRARRLYLAQSRRGAVTLSALFTLLFGLPVLFALAPALDEVRLYSIPLSWLLLVVVPFPAMAALAWWQLRRADKAEDR